MYRPERYTDQEEMWTSNDEIQTRKIYRPGRDEDAMTRYRPERQEDIQTRKRCRPATTRYRPGRYTDQEQM